MNPELPQVKTGAETAPQIPGGVEYHPETAPRGIETERGVEQILAVPVEGQPIVPPTTLPPVTSVVASPTSAPQATIPIASDDMPLLAADEDLIEKEWVDRAKQIVAKTRDDPRAQDEAIGRLQSDYLKKRYGKIISSNDG
jgi:hypothetical protein